jgi:hypothetical protein
VNTNAAMRVTSWEPPDPGYSPLDGIFASQSSVRGMILKVGSVQQHRSLLPRPRSNCYGK